MALKLDRGQVAELLDEIGLLLELSGQNPFKTRAYGNGARLLRGLDQDFEALVRDGGLTGIKGIGKALADKITTLATTGQLDYLDDLRQTIPAGLLDWLKIPGLGAKKARAIHTALEISTLGELEYACRENRLRDLPGFGKASQDKILAGIERLRRHAGRFRQPLIRGEAERLLALVRSVAGVIRAELGGSVRRRLETSKDIDIVAASTDPAPLIEAFAHAEGVESVVGKGPTKCSVQLASGPGADLRVVDDAAYPFALLYFSGSKAHNIALRGRAQRLGLKLNEYGLFRDDDDSPTACADEAAIYAALELGYIEPELREDFGEVEAAAQGRLPELIERAQLRGALHCHSSWSDGSASIREMAEGCRRLGLEYLGLCDHSQAAAYAGGLDAARVVEQHAEIDAINAEYDGAFRVIKGIEVDILVDGTLDFDDAVLARFELVVASVHSAFHLPAEQQTARMLAAVRHPYVDVIGHPTGRLLLARDPYPMDLSQVLDVAAERAVAVEINAHPHRLDLDWRSLRYGLKQGMRTCINPDAHSTEGLADIDYGVGVARKGGCRVDDVLNAWPVERLLDHFDQRRRRALGG